MKNDNDQFWPFAVGSFAFMIIIGVVCASSIHGCEMYHETFRKCLEKHSPLECDRALH